LPFVDSPFFFAFLWDYISKWLSFATRKIDLTIFGLQIKVKEPHLD